MKLELKHLAPYQEHKVKLMFKGEKYNIGYLSTKRIAFINQTNELIKMTWEQASIKVKPILRPLSDLNTKYGEDIINEHSINILIEEKFKLEYGIFSHYKGFLNIELDGDYDLRYDSNKSIGFDVIFEIQKQLFKNHYDVFGLIEKGLAIDINTL
jgi:hypothetical protein